MAQLLVLILLEYLPSKYISYLIYILLYYISHIHITLCITYYSQFVNRPFTNEMDVISRYIHQTATHIYDGNNDVIVSLPNHMTELSFYPKRPDVKEDLQLSYHNDCLWHPNGSWIPHKNTQAMNTATFSLTVGDSRILTMKEWKAGVGKEGVYSSLPEIKILLEHGRYSYIFFHHLYIYQFSN